jgi:hypothetical protein
MASLGRDLQPPNGYIIGTFSLPHGISGEMSRTKQNSSAETSLIFTASVARCPEPKIIITMFVQLPGINGTMMSRTKTHHLKHHSLRGNSGALSRNQQNTFAEHIRRSIIDLASVARCPEPTESITIRSIRGGMSSNIKKANLIYNHPDFS